MKVSGLPELTRRLNRTLRLQQLVVRNCIVLTVLMVVVLAVTNIGIAIASECPANQERQIVDAILNQSVASEEGSLGTMIDRLELSVALIPEPAFYHGLATWYRGYQMENARLKKQGIKQLRQIAKSAEDKYFKDNARNNFVVGIIKAYTARALFESQQVVNGYYTGIDAVERLDRFIQSASKETPGYHDAKFLLGLYSVYTHDLKTRSHWLIGEVDSVGNRSQSVKDIVKTIGSDAVFASESARAFLAEVHWRTPEICDYRGLANQSHQFLPENVDFALLAQGVFLKCGQPNRALSINNRYHTRQRLPEPVRNKMLKARLRVFADLGNTGAIQTLDLPPALKHYGDLALANAMDVSSSRATAIENYHTLLKDTAVREEIKRAAKVRLTYPYRSPAEVKKNARHLDLQYCETPKSDLPNSVPDS